MSGLRRYWAFLMLVAIGSALASAAPAAAPQVPNPVLSPTFIEPFVRDGKQYLRYRYEVFNRDEFPAQMFAPAPELPPCGKNTKASRTWVDVYDQRGQRLNGFCALETPAQLGDVWFALEDGAIPPSWIYIELTDRKTNTKYKSNLVETSL